MQNNSAQTIELYADDVEDADGGALLRMKNGAAPSNRETITLDAKAGSGGSRLSLFNGQQSLNQETITLDGNSIDSVSSGAGRITLRDDGGNIKVDIIASS